MQNGDFIKAKVDRNGEALYVGSLGYRGSQGRQYEIYFQAGRMGDEYFVLPAGQLGGLDISDKDAQYTVKSSEGEQNGHVYRIMTNQNCDLIYAIVRKDEGQLISVPWQALVGSVNQTFKLHVTKKSVRQPAYPGRRGKCRSTCPTALGSHERGKKGFSQME